MSKKPKIDRTIVCSAVKIGRCLEQIEHNMWALYGNDDRGDFYVAKGLRDAARKLKEAVRSLEYYLEDSKEDPDDHG